MSKEFIKEEQAEKLGDAGSWRPKEGVFTMSGSTGKCIEMCAETRPSAIPVRGCPMAVPVRGCPQTVGSVVSKQMGHWSQVAVAEH